MNHLSYRLVIGLFGVLQISPLWSAPLVKTGVGTTVGNTATSGASANTQNDSDVALEPRIAVLVTGDCKNIQPSPTKITDPSVPIELSFKTSSDIKPTDLAVDLLSLDSENQFSVPIPTFDGPMIAGVQYLSIQFEPDWLRKVPDGNYYFRVTISAASNLTRIATCSSSVMFALGTLVGNGGDGSTAGDGNKFLNYGGTGSPDINNSFQGAGAESAGAGGCKFLIVSAPTGFSTCFSVLIASAAAFLISFRRRLKARSLIQSL